MSNMCGHFLKPLGRSYYIRDLVAYTEDDISIKKLHFSSVPLQLTKDILMTYFSKFGRVSGIQVVRESMNPVPCVAGEVLFANPKDAAKALEIPTHSLDGNQFQVKPSYSWLQPDAYGKKQEQPQEATILKLNNDCWLDILPFLKLRDRLRFARTCQRFRAIYQMATARLYSSVNTRQFFRMNQWDIADICHLCSGDIQDLYKLTLWDIRVFYELSGGQIKDLECMLPMMDSDERFRFIPVYCRNLISLYLGRKVLSKDTMLSMPTTIEKLDLGKCFRVQNLPMIIKHFTELRKLNLGDVTDKMCQTMVKKNCCPKLEMLRLSPCEYSNCEVLAQLPSLKSLTIHSKNGTSTTGARLTEKLVEHKAELLEYLEFDCANPLPREQLSQISKLIGLRTLILPIWYGVKEPVLREFSNLKKLEQICFNYKGNSDAAILDLFISCPRLSHLSIFGYGQPTKEVIQCIADQVRREQANKSMRRKLPIEIGLPFDLSKPEEIHGSEDIIKPQFNYWCSLSNFRPERWS
ncbi:uncharacterized protein [Drosophila kikkawai]|uniref:RRM domain-containing protein n=1 Tax=Drosophila kikkawai TaxID=30033 RepID=A0A6P4J253_DROKI|nr:uncharacterized protein LOC108079570 [Drosophila kikkawai]